jgi:hypothetical protein
MRDLDHAHAGNHAAGTVLLSGLVDADGSDHVAPRRADAPKVVGNAYSPRTLPGSSAYARHKVEMTNAPVHPHDAAGTVEALQICGTDRGDTSGLHIVDGGLFAYRTCVATAISLQALSSTLTRFRTPRAASSS